jgi:hypothetical protein
MYATNSFIGDGSLKSYDSVYIIGGHQNVQRNLLPPSSVWNYFPTIGNHLQGSQFYNP